MDSAGRIEVVRELCSFEGRGPGTDAERRAGNMLAGRLRGIGRRAEIEPFFAHPEYAIVHLIHAAMGVAGSILATVQPAAGFALVLVAAVSTYLDLNTRLYLVRSLLFRRTSQNVVSPGDRPDSPARLILMAHYDAARTGYVFSKASNRFRKLPERTRVGLGPFRIFFWLGLAPLLPILGARMAGFDATWLNAVQAIPTIVLIVAGFLLIDIALSDIVPGAYDNASGVAAVLSAADELTSNPPQNLDVWVVLAGSEESFCEGSRAFVRAHRKEFDRATTAFVNVDSASYGGVAYEISQGPVISLPHDQQLIELCKALSDAGAAGGARPIRHPLLDDALPARVRRLRAITLRTTDADGNLAPWYHTHEDVPERVDAEALTHATDFLVSLARLIDRDAGRAAGTPPPPGRLPPPSACKDRAVEEMRGRGGSEAEQRPDSGLAEILWAPTPEMVERSQLTRYIRWLAENRDLHFEDYHALWRWSVTEIEEFWGTLWEYFEVMASGEEKRDLEHPSPEVVLEERVMPGANWFPGTRLNYAEHIFRGKGDDEVAVLYASELRELSELRWGELREQVGAVREGLQALGVTKGDRVVAYLPNGPEALIAFLASASLGAIWSSCSPDFGPGSIVDRFAQIEPKVMFAVDGYRYGGKDFDRMEVVADVAAQIPSLERIVVVPYLSASPELSIIEEHPKAAAPMTWGQLADLGSGAELRFKRVPFDHPLWVLYSSGTTGLPKAIVQGHGGILMEQLKKGYLHLDAQPGDRLFWFTTTGWMMWNFLIGGLLTPASIVLYDGNPAYPDMGVLWDLAERTGETTFGTSAAYIAACMKDGIKPEEGRDLSRLRSVGSTGSPLSPEGFDWIYEHLGNDTWLFSTSGGTDVCTAFVGGVPTLPVYKGELQARALAAKIEAFDEDGNPVVDEVGELVITEPMPSMPVFFWGDEDGSRYRASYFETYAGVWRHGDWIEITSRGTAIIYGRSDSTINRGGIRMGTAEIYRAVADVPEVLDSLVVDVPKPGTEGWMPLFVVLREGAELNDELAGQIKRRIREQCSPRHVPNEIFQIKEVPRTLSGKVLEVPVKRILMGEPPEKAASRDSLANPAALDYFTELAGTI